MSTGKGTLELLRQENAEYKAENVELRDLVEKHEARIQQLLRDLQGKQSEKLDPDELLEACHSFFTQEELEFLQEAEPEAFAEPDLPDPPKKKPPSRKRKLNTENLPRELKDVLLDAESCQCPACGRMMDPIGFEVTEKIGFRPASFYVKQYRCEKRACSCGQGIATAKLPAQPVPKGKAEPDLLAQIVVSKFQDHCPFYRQSRIYGREGMDIGDTTLVEWSNQVADLLAPVLYAMIREVQSCGYIQADETGLRVLVKGKGKCHNGYLWSYGQPHGTVVFDFQMTRARDGPTDFLAEFSGKLQSDAYAGYDATKKRADVLWFPCWAHARRKFREALDTAEARTSKILKYIQALYRIEKDARSRGLSAGDRAQLRQEKARPILSALKTYLKQIKPEVLPKSDLGKAVQYVLKRWSDFERYVDHGEVEIDNNMCENSVRGIALGRKNFLFAGSESGGEKAACLYSFVETCKRLSINTHEYLTDVLRSLPSTPPAEIVKLTPQRWKEARRAAEKLAQPQ